MLNINPYWYLILWVIAFAIPFAILSILSKDPYFNPHKGWILLVSVSGGFQLNATVFGAVQTYNLLFVLSPATAIIAGVAAAAVITAIWVWASIQFFV